MFITSWIAGYLRFLLAHPRRLAFGVLATAGSGFGQTYFIGLYNADLRAAFELSHGAFGGLYAAATLASALTLPWVNRLYDRWRLCAFILLAAVLLAAGAATLSLAVGGGMLLALFLLRLGGQGMMGHVGVTTMARSFSANRGKATSIAALGFPLGEALWPALALGVGLVLAWWQAWGFYAVVTLVGVVPLLLWLARSHRGGPAEVSGPPPGSLRDWHQREVLRDPRFLLLLPAGVAAPFIVTILFFHQVPLASARDWGAGLITAGLAVFAATHVSGLLLAGPLVDRYTARRLLPWTLLPLLGSVLALAWLTPAWGALVWPGLLGLGLGFGSTTVGSLWAELYGVHHLGAIRGLFQAVAVFSTAAGPVMVGMLLDAGLGPRGIGQILAAVVVGATVLALVALRRTRSGP